MNRKKKNFFMFLGVALYLRPLFFKFYSVLQYMQYVALLLLLHCCCCTAAAAAPAAAAAAAADPGQDNSL